MPPTSPPTNLYTAKGDIEDVLSEHGVELTLDDDGDGTAGEDEEVDALNKAIYWATSRINLHCAGLYKTARLAQSWVVNYWASVLAARQLAGRRGNTVPQSLEQAYQEAKEDLDRVKNGDLSIPEIATRANSWPTWSNIRVNPYRRLRKARVEKAISEGSPTPRRQHTDVGADYIREW